MVSVAHLRKEHSVLGSKAVSWYLMCDGEQVLQSCQIDMDQSGVWAGFPQ